LLIAVRLDSALKFGEDIDQTVPNRLRQTGSYLR
jgi:hypothetical protein